MVVRSGDEMKKRFYIDFTLGPPFGVRSLDTEVHDVLTSFSS